MQSAYDSPHGTQRVSSRRPDGSRYLHGLFVHPDHRGKGEGTRILNQVTADADAEGTVLQFHTREDMVPFFERFGFQRTGQDQFGIIMQRQPKLAEAIVRRLVENDEEINAKEFIMSRPTPKSIEIEGRQWWRRGAGGTYYTAHVYVDGNKVHVTPENGGGGNQYLEVATDWLENEGYIPPRPRGTPGWAWIRDHLNIPLNYYAREVKRERDLF